MFMERICCSKWKRIDSRNPRNENVFVFLRWNSPWARVEEWEKERWRDPNNWLVGPAEWKSNSRSFARGKEFSARRTMLCCVVCIQVSWVMVALRKQFTAEFGMSGVEPNANTNKSNEVYLFFTYSVVAVILFHIHLILSSLGWCVHVHDEPYPHPQSITTISTATAVAIGSRKTMATATAITRYDVFLFYVCAFPCFDSEIENPDKRNARAKNSCEKRRRIYLSRYFFATLSRPLSRRPPCFLYLAVVWQLWKIGELFAVWVNVHNVDKWNTRPVCVERIRWPPMNTIRMRGRKI